MHFLALLTLPLLITLVTAQCTPHGSLTFLSPVSTAQGLSAVVISANLTTPRGIAIDTAQNLLVIERGLGVTAFTETDRSCDGWLRTVVINDTSLTQGIQVNGGSLYVSSAATVMRYAYDPASRTVYGGPTTLINGIPPDGELTTRPILLHPPEKPTSILVSSALSENIDPTARNPSSLRSQIRIFPLSTAPNPVPQNFSSGELLVFGIRNPAGFSFLPPFLSTNLWVVDNGASIDNVTGLTATFVNDNPADELNLVPNPLAGGNRTNIFYGFPDCTTLWNPLADPVGDPQFTHLKTGDQFSLHLEPGRDDAWCRLAQNNVPSRLSFQAHSVPLDLKFFFPGTTGYGKTGLPSVWAGDAFVTFHGSFDRDPPTGYGVVRVPFSDSQPAAGHSSDAGYSFLVQAANLTTCPGTCIRPVGAAFADDGRLFVTSDSSGELFVISSRS